LRAALPIPRNHDDKDEYSHGFDAQGREFKDLVKAGIMTGIRNPTKVVRTALRDAASVAGLLVTAETMVAEKPEKKSPPMPPDRRRHERHGLLIEVQRS
jgi:chaperonin GroEL (HSP60 family)